MRRIPKMKNRRCSNCGHEFALWLHGVPLRHSVAKKLAGLWIFMWCAALSVAVGLLVGFVLQWHSGR